MEDENMTNGFTIRCSCHTYITLEYEDKFVFCLDNDMAYMEDIIEKIEKSFRSLDWLKSR